MKKGSRRFKSGSVKSRSYEAELKVLIVTQDDLEDEGAFHRVGLLLPDALVQLQSVIPTKVSVVEVSDFVQVVSDGRPIAKATKPGESNG